MKLWRSITISESRVSPHFLDASTFACRMKVDGRRGSRSLF